MSPAPKPVGVIATGQSLHSRTLELCMVRIEALDGLEGREVVLVAGPYVLGHGGFVRSGAPVRVLAVAHEDAVEVLLNAQLSALVPAVCHGDGLYLADEVGPWVERQEAAYVETWKAERRAR